MTVLQTTGTAPKLPRAELVATGKPRTPGAIAAVSPRASRHLLVPPFNGAEVRRRGCSYAGVELPQHRQTQLFDRLILDRVPQ